MARVFLALGSNLGDRREQLRQSLSALGRRGIRTLRASSLYESEPMYYANQPAFLNAAIEAETELSPEDLLAAAKAVEHEQGRQERFRNGPREVDVDLLTYGDERRDSPELTLPHPRIQERPFVRVPLGELQGAASADEPGLRRVEGPGWAGLEAPAATRQLRLFVAVDVGEEVRRHMASVQAALREQSQGMKWVKPKLSHITVQFLGSVDGGRLRDIEAACAEAAAQAAAFELAFAGLGVFPDWRRPRVLWIGVREGEEPAARLQRAVQRELASIGLLAEERAFTPHLTLGRFKEPLRRPDAERLQVAAAGYAERDFGRTPVTAIQLMQSVLSRSGPAYTVLSSWALGAAPPTSR